MSAPDVPAELVEMVRIDRALERLDRGIDHALDSNDQRRFQALLRRRSELLAQRNAIKEH